MMSTMTKLTILKYAIMATASIACALLTLSIRILSALNSDK